MFNILICLNKDLFSNITKNIPFANVLKKIALIILDEIQIKHCYYVGALDKNF